MLWRKILYVAFFSLIKVFILLLNQGGSLSLHTIVSCGIKLLRILRTVLLLKISTFSLTFVFENAPSQLNSLNDKFLNSLALARSRNSYTGQLLGGNP